MKLTELERDIAWKIFNAVDGPGERETFERELRRVSNALGRFSGIEPRCLTASRNIIAEYLG